mmetsp:Transcript_16740/g.31564  ORF Transcript_16740/g.31564 Transcript_16740/m.31564 type:complete len:280 (+) Transcript_16740:326-1165(+)
MSRRCGPVTSWSRCPTGSGGAGAAPSSRAPGCVARPRWCCSRRPSRSAERLGAGQGGDEAAAASVQPVLDVHLAAQAQHRTAHDGQAQARAGDVAAARAPPEAFERGLALVGRDAGAVVSDAQLRRRSVGAEGDRHPAAGRHIAQRVVDQVQQHRFERGPIDPCRQRGRRVQREVQAALECLRRQLGERLLDEIGQVQRLRGAGAGFVECGQRQQLAAEMRSPPQRRIQGLGGLAAFGLAAGGAQQMGLGGHDGHGRAQLMGGVLHEGAFTLQLGAQPR